MTFLTVMGGLLVFGFLWLAFPRAAFAVALMVIFSQALKVGGPWGELACLLLGLGVIVGFVLDFAVGKTTLED